MTTQTLELNDHQRAFLESLPSSPERDSILEAHNEHLRQEAIIERARDFLRRDRAERSLDIETRSAIEAELVTIGDTHPFMGLWFIAAYQEK